MVDFRSGNSLLLLMQDVNYQKNITSVLKQLHLRNVCYITFNKTSEFLIEFFNKKGINTDSIVFIDVISEKLHKTRKHTNQYFIKSDFTFTEINHVLDQLINKGFDHIVFDSLTNLLVYRNKPQAGRFINGLLRKVGKINVRILFYALLKNEHEELIKDVSSKVDKIINFSE